MRSFKAEEKHDCLFRGCAIERNAGMEDDLVSRQVPGGVFLKDEIRSLPFYIAAFFILFLSSVVVVSAFLFFIRNGIKPFVLPVSFVMSSAGLWILLAKENKGRTWLLLFTVLCFFFIIASVSLALAGMFYDASWDGQDYHQPAIIALADGWNPVFDPFPSTVTFDSEAPLWIDHYPKASWILGAAIYQVTGFIELGKSVNMVFLVVAILLVFRALSEYGRLPFPVNLLLSALIPLTPVFCYQFLSFYVDDLASCIVITEFALAALALVDAKRFIYLPMLGLAIVLAVNIKFTCIAFSFIVAIGFIAFSLARDKSIAKLVKPVLLLLSAAAIGLAVTGFNPYVTNTFAHGHPLHPVFGKEGRDVVTSQKPANFLRMNPVESLLYSLFSEGGTDHAQNAEGFNPASLKVPFTIAKDEVRFSNSDPRAGGFGTMFGGMLILSLLLFAVHCARLAARKRTRLLFVHAGIIAWILASVLVIPDSWWARWIPQLWILPLVIVAMSAGVTGAGDAGGKRSVALVRIPVLALQVAIVILALVNDGIILGHYVNLNATISGGVKEELSGLAENPGPVAVFAYKFDGAAKARLRDIGCAPYDVDYIHGIDYKDVVSCTTSFGYVMFGVPKEPRAELDEYATAEMPQGVAVLEPDASIAESAAVFSGVWRGKLSAVIDTIVIVSSIDRDLSVSLTAATGGYRAWKIENTRYDMKGTIRIDSPATLRAAKGDIGLTLIAGDDRNSIEIMTSGTNASGSGYLRRINPANNKPHVDFKRKAFDLRPLVSRDLPLPENIEMTKPDSSLPDSLEALYGLWEGSLAGVMDAAVFVGKITPIDAELVVSWKSNSQNTKGFANMAGRVVMNDPPEIHANNANGMKLRLIPGTAGNSIECRMLVRWYVFSSAYMHKRSLQNE